MGVRACGCPWRSFCRRSRRLPCLRAHTLNRRKHRILFDDGCRVQRHDFVVDPCLERVRGVRQQVSSRLLTIFGLISRVFFPVLSAFKSMLPLNRNPSLRKAEFLLLTGLQAEISAWRSCLHAIRLTDPKFSMISPSTSSLESVWVLVSTFSLT